MYQWKKELVAAEGGGTVQIARWFLATNQDGLEAEFEWPILIRKLPKTPELDMFLTIDEMGRVTRVALGWRLSRLGGGCGLRGATPLGLMIGRPNTQGSAKTQPWALGRKPVGLREGGE